MKKRSISQRLNKARSPVSKANIALAWAQNWKDEHDGLIRDLERAIRNDDYDLLCITTGQLKAVGQKRLDALPRVLSHMLETDSPTNAESMD
ncbi:hypothetical protein [Paenibacillus medicaginis]|uniref:Uncharacterized protein n=1 Tax=Paenibacillus medicaginis TaxID=1470560 RepID=A0ABV5BUU7_9BACL